MSAWPPRGTATGPLTTASGRPDYFRKALGYAVRGLVVVHRPA